MTNFTKDNLLLDSNSPIHYVIIDKENHYHIISRARKIGNLLIVDETYIIGTEGKYTYQYNEFNPSAHTLEAFNNIDSYGHLYDTDTGIPFYTLNDNRLHDANEHLIVLECNHYPNSYQIIDYKGNSITDKIKNSYLNLDLFVHTYQAIRIYSLSSDSTAVIMWIKNEHGAEALLGFLYCKEKFYKLPPVNYEKVDKGTYHGIYDKNFVINPQKIQNFKDFVLYNFNYYSNFNYTVIAVCNCFDPSYIYEMNPLCISY